MFTDEDQGLPAVPNTFWWTLTDAKTPAAVINHREEVPVTPAAEVRVLLSGDDLATFEGLARELRVFTYGGTYTDTSGPNTPFRGQIALWVDNLVAEV